MSGSEAAVKRLVQIAPSGTTRAEDRLGPWRMTDDRVEAALLDQAPQRTPCPQDTQRPSNADFAQPMYGRAGRAQFVLRPPCETHRELGFELRAKRTASRKRHQHGLETAIKIARANVQHSHQAACAESSR